MKEQWLSEAQANALSELCRLVSSAAAEYDVDILPPSILVPAAIKPPVGVFVHVLRTDEEFYLSDATASGAVKKFLASEKGKRYISAGSVTELLLGTTHVALLYDMENCC